MHIIMMVVLYLPSTRIYYNGVWRGSSCKKYSPVVRNWVVHLNLILTVITPIQFFIYPVPCQTLCTQARKAITM